MGYNKENFSRISEEYSKKYIKAEKAAVARHEALAMEIPEFAQIDKAIADIGFEGVMAAMGASKAKISDLKEKSLALQSARAELLKKNGYPENYLDIEYDCEKCKDTGYVGGKMCECMKRALIMAGYESSGIAKLMQKQTFESFSLDYYGKAGSKNHEQMKLVFNTMKSFAEGFQDEKMENLVLFGGTGLGKTHLSTAVAKNVIDRGFDVLYVSSVGLIQSFERARFGGRDDSYSQIEDYSIVRYYESDLLIIDDLGTEIINQFTISTIYNLLNTRLNKQKSTIISTNQTPAELREKYCDRIASRIFGEFKPLIFCGTDIRMQKLKNLQ